MPGPCEFHVLFFRLNSFINSSILYVSPGLYSGDADEERPLFSTFYRPFNIRFSLLELRLNLLNHQSISRAETAHHLCPVEKIQGAKEVVGGGGSSISIQRRSLFLSFSNVRSLQTCHHPHQIIEKRTKLRVKLYKPENKIYHRISSISWVCKYVFFICTCKTPEHSAAHQI